MSKKLPPELEELANRAFEMAENPTLIFGSEGERDAVLFSHIKAKSKAWDKPQRCMYKGCAERSVPKSHTLQRGGPISRLTENGHVLTPRFENGAFLLKQVGASIASTFPGFCSKHELLFAGFESTGVIAGSKDLELQIFRGICRELQRKRHDLEWLKQGLAQVRNRLDEKVKAAAHGQGISLDRLEIKGGIFGAAEAHLASANEAVSDLEALYDAHFPSVDDSGNSGLGGQAFQTNIEFPVALSGFGVLGFKGRAVNCLLGIIPQSGGSLIYMAALEGDADAIQAYLQRASFDLPLIDIVEEWMVRGSDHWFLRPSVWASIPAARQGAILEEIPDISKGLGNPLCVSIFDDLRRTALAAPEAPVQANNVKAYIAAQRAKLE